MMLPLYHATVFSMVAFNPFVTPSQRAWKSTPARMTSPRLQAQPSPPLQQVNSEAELQEAISNAPPMGISLLMFCISGDKKAVKVRSYLEDKCGDNEMLQRIVWQCDRDDSEALNCVGADVDRTPLFIGYDASGARVLDFVAMTPSALFYGLENLGGVLDAYAQQEARMEQPATGASDGAQAAAVRAGPSEEQVAALELNVQILEAKVYELELQLSKQQAELFGASRKYEALLKRVDALEEDQQQRKASGLSAADIEAAMASPADSGGRPSVADLIRDVPDDDVSEIMDPFAYVLGED